MPRPNVKQVPAAPFVEWIERELRKLHNEHDLGANGGPSCSKILAERLGIAPRVLYRYRYQRMDLPRDTRNAGPPYCRHTDWFERDRIELLLERAGVQFWEVYPEIAAAEEPELEPDAFCPRCAEWVTPINSLCPWHRKPVPVENWRAA